MQALKMKQPRRYRWLKLSVFIIVYSVFHAVLSAPSEPENIDPKDTPPKYSDALPKTKETPTQDIAAKAKETPAEVKEILETKLEKDLEHGKVKGEVIEEIKLIKETKDKEGHKEIKEEDIVIKEITASGETEKKPKEDEGDKKGGKKGEAKEDGNTEEEGKDVKDEGGKNKQKNFHKLNATSATLPAADTTFRAKRENCTPPAIEQFPRPLMGPYARKHGGLIIHVLVAVFTFVGLAIICDDYFVSSLDRICEEMKLTPDVAGATFMAAGSSAPELATVIIGVFWAQDDIGVSGVIGSAVFNIMFVISVCALCAGTVSHLNWWPLCRDCFFYAISILVMLCTIWDGFISRGEALFMLIMYVVYCVALYFNNRLENWSARIPLPFKLPTKEEQAALVTYRSTAGEKPASADGSYAKVEGTTQETPLQPANYNADGTYENAAYNAEPTPGFDPNQSWDPNRSWDDPQNQVPVWDPNSTWNSDGQPQSQPQPQPRQRPPDQPAEPTDQQLTIQPAAPAQNYYKAKEYNAETAINPLNKPANANIWQLICYYVSYPVHWSARITMPDCRGRWYPVTFCVSMLWISFYSYFMVWMITIIGSTLSIPDTVMGLTFVAAGVSVPDALSSLAVIKEGYGDMAVSNAIGSNVFDILVCLGLPWFIQTAIIKPGSYVNVISKGLIYSTLSLFSTVVFLVLATHLNGWKLDRKYGVILMVWYILFISFASMYELNVFGNIHPPDCPSYF